MLNAMRQCVLLVLALHTLISKADSSNTVSVVTDTGDISCSAAWIS